MMTSTQIRQSFLDFFRSKQHTIVRSSPLDYKSRDGARIFTNAGMNQFVPIFLGEEKAEVNRWADCIPGLPTRAADTQKCIRATGKHNDLDDVGLDTYHHTFFEMLGNWSFGDYFKQDAINWAWELIIEVWKFPPTRLYATIYQPDKSKNDPADRDEEAWSLWAEKFRSVGLDPDVHIVNGNKKDNFWMMGETGPCGPCTEMHVDLRPGPVATDLDAQKSGALLVNGSDARCIEIWNNVFIQYNANPDGTFSPLPAQHVDTGMGFERVTSIIQGTKNLTDFQNAKISNYETDIFRPIFDAIEKLSGKKYGSTLPKPGSTGDTEQEKIDVAFRVIGDHIRTLSFAIADGIEPDIKGRNGVLRSIHKRMVRYASTIDVKDEILVRTQDALVDTLAMTMGDIFPEVRAQKEHIKKVLRRETDVFNKTLDKGIEVFERAILELNTVKEFVASIPASLEKIRKGLRSIPDTFPVSITELEADWAAFNLDVEGKLQTKFVESAIETALRGTFKVGIIRSWAERITVLCQPASEGFAALQDAQNSPSEFEKCRAQILREFSQIETQLSTLRAEATEFPGGVAFLLHDTYGFPLDLTELMARERGLDVDTAGFEKLMEEQRARARAAQKKEVISLSQIETTTPTQFVGFEKLETPAKVLEVASLKDKTAVILDTTACYAEMGGQVGDTGELSGSGQLWRVTNTQKSGNTWLHFLDVGDRPSAIGDSTDAPAVGSTLTLAVEKPRRDAIQRHHTVTHLLHWALHEVVSQEASQKGSFVGPDKLTFDFNSAALTPAQVADIEKLVNERILENAAVSWTEVPHADVKNRKDVMQFFGDKYGDLVRVVQIGGHAAKLDGYSMELCGGTHTRATGEIGLFRIIGENAIAAGVRRIEAVAGLEAYRLANDQLRLLRTVAGQLNTPVAELEKKVEAILSHQKELEKQIKSAQQKEAAGSAKSLLAKAETLNGTPAIIANIAEADGDTLQIIADALKAQFKGVIVLGGAANGAVSLIAAVTPDYTAKVQAGKIIQAIAPIVGGKGGGKPDNARGGGKDATKLDEALAKARELLT